MKKMTIDDLNKLYSEADTADQEVFAEQRSNILLSLGDHFTKKGSRFWNRIRDSKDLSNEQKLRLTKNHIQKIVKAYVNNIVTQAPGVTIVAKNDKELQDQKAAELHSAVWFDLKTRHNLKKKISEWVRDFIEIGEVHLKIFWDPSKGKLLGYEPQLDEFGMPVMDPETGAPVATDVPKFSGDLVFERLFAFDLLRAPEAKSMEESRFLCHRKMTAIEELKLMVGDDQEKLKFIEESKDGTYVIFDSGQGYSKSSKEQALVKEWFFRPCGEYPNGYFYITTDSGILFEGELPFGVFPIVSCGFDESPTSPRARSIIKQLRPYQAEVNRTASKIAETQITLGDDKLLIQDGTKISHGGQVPGVRAVKYTGMAPVVMPGRSGDQYLAYMQSQIEEMYRISDIDMDLIDKSGQSDPYAMLFRSLQQKKQFSLYASKVESFLVDACKVALTLAKNYYSDDLLVPAIGKREIINIAEFRSSDDIGYQIVVEPQVDDVETKMGKQMTLTNVLQYVGNQLSKDDIGKIIRLMPYGNNEQVFGDFTIDFDNATNDILALDRGEYTPSNQHDNHEYVIKRLINRTKQSDFRFLPPEIQRLYMDKIQEHELIMAEQSKQIAAAKSEWIPTSGYLVVCDLYVSDPANPEKTRRARVPYDALSWLIQKLERQGTALKDLEMQTKGVQSDLARIALQEMGQSSQDVNGGLMNQAGTMGPQF